MNIDPVKFVNIEHDSFRELESLFTEKYFKIIDSIKSGKLSADDLVKFHTDIMEGISQAEGRIIAPLLEKASREAMIKIFKQHKTPIIGEKK